MDGSAVEEDPGRQRAPDATGIVLEQRLHPIPDTALVRGEPPGPCVSRPVVRRPSFTVPIDIVSGGSEDVGVVLQQSEALVTSLAEQLPDATRLVIVVEVLRAGIPADAASVVLCRPQGVQLTPCQLVLAVEVAVRVGRSVTGPASRTESRGGTSVARVVLVRDRLLAGRAPPEAVRNPGVIANKR